VTGSPAGRRSFESHPGSITFWWVFGYLLIAAVVVQLGNSAFRVANPALVHEVAEGNRQES
jgi:hypothetical protein